MQLFSEQELMDLCCPEENFLSEYKGKMHLQSQLEQEVERLRLEIHQLESQALNSDTHS